MSEEEQKPLSGVEVAHALSEMVTAVLGKRLTRPVLVSRLRKLADRIEDPSGTSKKPKTKKEKAPVPEGQVGAIFEFWKVTLDHPGAMFTDGRRKAITDRIREGYDDDTLRRAIVGCSRSPHHMGKNEEKTRYDDVTLIMRNGEKVEWFAAKADAAPVIGGPRAKADEYDPREHGDQGHLGGEYARKWNLFVDVGADRYEREWAKRSGA